MAAVALVVLDGEAQLLGDVVVASCDLAPVADGLLEVGDAAGLVGDDAVVVAVADDAEAGRKGGVLAPRGRGHRVVPG